MKEQQSRDHADPVLVGQSLVLGMSSPARPSVSRGYASDTATLVTYCRRLLKRKAILAFAAATGALIGIGISLCVTPLYRAKASIEVQDVNENFLYARQFDPNAGVSTYSAEFNLPTLVRLLKSDRLVQNVVDELKVYRRFRSREAAYATAQKHLTVQIATQLAAQTRMLEIIFDSPNAEEAANFANALAGDFVDDNIDSKLKIAQTTNERLTRQMQDFKRRLERSENALQAYTGAAGMVFTGEVTAQNAANDKLKQLQVDLSAATVDRIAKQARYELTQKVPVESLPEVLDDAGLREDQSRLTDLRRQAADLDTTLLPSHYKVLRLQAQISFLEAGLARKRQVIVDRLGNEYESSQRRENLLAAAFGVQGKVVSEQSVKMIRYDMLRREVDANRRLYEDLLQKVSESAIAVAMRSNNLRVVDIARKPSAPYSPNVPLNATVGCAVGLFIGVAAVFFIEGASTRICDAGAAPRYLNVPELGIIPSIRAEVRTRENNAGVISTDLRWKTMGRSGLDHSRILSDSFRGTFTSLMYGNPKQVRVITLTSSNPREGKTTVASNLAISAAELHDRVLLIDGDLRRGRLGQVFDIEAKLGLSELLRNTEPIRSCSLQPYLHKTRVSGLSVILSGQRELNPVKLLYGDRFRHLLDRLREDFDYVFVDTPPMLHIPDARIIAKAGDAVVLVIQANQTTVETVTTARERLAEDGVKVVGTVLNNWHPPHGNGAQHYPPIEDTPRRA